MRNALVVFENSPVFVEEAVVNVLELLGIGSASTA